MSYDLTAREFKRVLALVPQDRLSHFIERVKATGEIWTLANDEALLVLGNENHPEFVAVWPHADYAMNWFEEAGIDEADLVSMQLSDWLDGTLAEFTEAGIEIDVFPTAEQEGLILSAERFTKQFTKSKNE